MRDDHIALKFKEVQSMFRLPGFIRAETLMDFWGCKRSLVSRRLKLIDHRRLAVVKSEHMGGGQRWYWIDPYIPDSMDCTLISQPKQPRISVALTPALLARCRAQCRLEGMTMSAWVAQLVEQEINGLRGKAPRRPRGLTSIERNLIRYLAAHQARNPRESCNIPPRTNNQRTDYIRAIDYLEAQGYIEVDRPSEYYESWVVTSLKLPDTFLEALND